MMTLAPGTRLGPYEIVSPIAAGGMGEVYRATDSRLGRDVAIKIIPETLSREPGALARFEREARAVAALTHPNVLAIHDFGVENDIAYAVTELLEGETLRTRMGRGAISWKRASEMGASIADGLAAAHAKRIVHRDLKPENIFLTADGRVKILDFGLAKQSDAEPTPKPAGAESHTDETVMVGTVGYMAPEQILNETVDHRTDIFNLGLLLFEMAAGRPAFVGANTIKTLHAVIDADAPRLSDLAPGVPPEADALVAHCLEKSPEMRFQSARDLAFALRALSNDSGIRTTTRSGELVAPSLAELRAHRPSTGRGRSLAVAALVAVVAAAGAFALGRYTARSPLAETSPLRYLTYSGQDSAPAASPDGRLLAFTSDRDGRKRIWLKQLSGEGEAPLTDGSDDFARFDPDGSSILFARVEAGESALYRTAVVGGQQRRVIEDAMDGDWSPDGKRIAFVRWKRDAGRVDSVLGIADATGEGARELASIPSQTLLHPRWSPDGTRIALVENGQTRNVKIFVVTVETGQVKELAPPVPGGYLSAVAWCDGGSEIVYAFTESVAVGLSGSAARVIRQNVDAGDGSTVFWIPSRTEVVDILGSGRIVFETRSLRQNLHQSSIGSKDPAAEQWLTRGGSADRQPVYSPDGEWVAFSSNRNGSLDLWIVSTTSGSVRPLTDNASDDWDPAFSRDGKSIVWSSNRSGRFEIWMADVDGSHARQISNDGFNAENPSLSPDAAWVVYSSGSTEGFGLWKAPTDGGKGIRLLAEKAVWPEVSPDGKYVLFVVRQPESSEIGVVEFATGTVTPFKIRVESGEGRARWMPDGRAIAFTASGPKGAKGVYVQDFDVSRDTASTRRPLAGFEPGIDAESFGISPDGARITIAGTERLWSLASVENLPRIAPPRRRE